MSTTHRPANPYAAPQTHRPANPYAVSIPAQSSRPVPHPHFVRPPPFPTSFRTPIPPLPQPEYKLPPTIYTKPLPPAQKPSAPNAYSPYDAVPVFSEVSGEEFILPTHGISDVPATHPANHVYTPRPVKYSVADAYGPINPRNTPITNDDIRSILRKYGVTAPPMNYELYHRAFVHESYTRDMHPDYVETPLPDHETAVESTDGGPQQLVGLALKTVSNQRIECMGDGVLELAAKFCLYKRFPVKDEGFMTDTKIEMVKNETVGKMAMHIGLDRWYLVSRGEERTNIRTNTVKLGCLFEAFVGAIFLDFNRMSMDTVEERATAEENGIRADMFTPELCGPGFQVAMKFIDAVFDMHLDWTNILVNSENYKRTLQELLQNEFRAIPLFDSVTPALQSVAAGGTYNALTAPKDYHMGVFLVIGAELGSHPVQAQGRGRGRGCWGRGDQGTRPQFARGWESSATDVTAFSSFRDIHLALAKSGRIVLCLGRGTHVKKQKAEQMACKVALEVLKNTMSDFTNTVARTCQPRTA